MTQQTPDPVDAAPHGEPDRSALPDDPTARIPAPGTAAAPHAEETAEGTEAAPQATATDPEQAADEAEPAPDAAEPAPDEAGADPDETEADPEPFSEGPPPLPEPMLVLDGDLPPTRPQQQEAVDHGSCESCGGPYDEDGWCTRCGERRPNPRHHVSQSPSAAVAGVCDRGRRHRDNEDAMALWADNGQPGRVVLVVCDGVSSAPRSAEASEAAANAAVAALTGEGPPQDRHVAGAAAAAAAVEEVAAQVAGSAPSCTYVSAIVQDGRVTVGSIGDSRAYWLPDAGDPARLSTDDSMAEEQVRAGIDRAEAEAGPLGHTITRWLGPDAPDVRPEITEQDVSEPGWLLVCSDGLWNYASEPTDLAAVVAATARQVGADPLPLAQGLVDWANGRGGADNITVALARCGDTRQDGGHG
ncbi:PP2C family protein-serine/threonine phosphatase [Serinicoccus kebangsaanensis]|uniref:PP2C family protein-serine/threonine phosphatase n=1 Tax=Serinicoccus kebangsaanensis TaxID=2602069 RepID=UPI00124F620D|nr:protein phosphatase 2C domain-containing protein [Serinicoccus kebangsaanensis]